MPIKPRDYEPVPYAGPPAYVPNYGTLGELMGLRARNTQQGWAQLASVFNNFVETRNRAEVAKAALAQKQKEQEAENQLKRDALAEKIAATNEAERVRREAQERQDRMDTERRGNARAKAIGYGPMAEMDVDPVMQSERAGDVRYAFGPGTANGPELQPTPEQQRGIELENAVKAQGGIVGPNGTVHMPPAAPRLTFSAPTPALVGGKRVFVRAGSDGKTYDMAGQPLTSGEPTPIPPVSSAASPDGIGNVALSPDAIEEAAHRVRLFGPASIPTRFNEGDKKRILNRSAEINKAIGQTPAAAAMRSAVQKADQGALNQITKQAASAEAFENKARQQADLVKSLSGKVGRTDLPIINGVLVSGKAALGNTPAHLLANALLTYTSEYAKIIEGSTGSAAGSSDAARRAAASLISTALSKGTLAATVDQMNREMGMTRTGYRTTIDDITSRMSGLGSDATQTTTPRPKVTRDANGNLVAPPKGKP